MRAGLLVFVVSCLACGRSTPAPTVRAPAPPHAPQDPEAAVYTNWRTANNDIDVAVGNLEEGMTASKELASSAGGTAGQALKQVVDLLNSAGEDVSDCDDVPDSLEEFKREFAVLDESRIRSIGAAVKGLRRVDSASAILENLSANVPEKFKGDLSAVSADVNDSAEELKEAIKLMGGKVPADDEDVGDA